MKTEKCVSCGFCCTVRPCAYAYAYARVKGQNPSKVWDGSKCVFLKDDDTCGIYKTIKHWDNMQPENTRMFDCGCSSSLFNDRREKKILDFNEDIV